MMQYNVESNMGPSAETKSPSELELQRQLEAEIAQMQASIALAQQRSERQRSSVQSLDDGMSVGSTNTEAMNRRVKKKVVRRFVQKAHAPSQAPPVESHHVELKPVDSTPDAIANAQSAEWHRKKLEDEIRQMEEQIASQRRVKIQDAIADRRKSIMAPASATAAVPPAVSTSASAEDQARMRLEEEVQAMELLAMQLPDQPKRKTKKKVVRRVRSKQPAGQSFADAERLKLEAEIRAMEQAILRQSYEKQLQPTYEPVPPEPTYSPPKPVQPIDDLSQDQQNLVTRYKNMAKLGLPEGAVRHKMRQDGVDEDLLAAYVFGSTSPPASSCASSAPAPRMPPPPRQQAPLPMQASKALPELSPEQEALVSRYKNMAKMGLPEGAVRHKMRQEGADADLLAAHVFGGGSTRASSNSAPRMPAAPVGPPSFLSSIAEAAQAPRKPVEESSRPAPSAAPPGLMSSIASAASARAGRLESGGELYMQDYMPEVAAPKQTTPQLSFDLAEMVTKRAMDREKRLAAGGEKKMTVIKEKEEYKKDFATIVLEAAQLGRLTRLNEHVVEAVAKEKTPEQEWKSSGLLAIQWRSNHMSVIHEAARVGAETKMPERITSNFPEEEQQDFVYYENDFLSPRMQQLNELNRRAGSGQHKVDKLILGRKEERDPGDSLLVRPMFFYSNVDDVVLPKREPPKIDPTKAKKKWEKKVKQAEAEHRPMIDISNEVATRAWERRARLDRPNMMPRVTEHCDCPYCAHASPYQTYAYRVKEIRRKQEGYESPPETQYQHQNDDRAERERRRAERWRRQHQPEKTVDESQVGMSAAKKRFEPAPEPKAASNGYHNANVVSSTNEAEMVSHVPSSMPQYNEATSHTDADADGMSMDSNNVGMPEVPNEPRQKTRRVVRKVRRKSTNKENAATPAQEPIMSVSHVPSDLERPTGATSIGGDQASMRASDMASVGDDTGSVSASVASGARRLVRKIRRKGQDGQSTAAAAKVPAKALPASVPEVPQEEEAATPPAPAAPAVRVSTPSRTPAAKVARPKPSAAAPPPKAAPETASEKKKRGGIMGLFKRKK